MRVKSPTNISLADRLRFGSLGLQEIAALKGLSVAKVRDDVRRGVLPTTQHGRRVLVRGADAAKYLEGAAS